MLLAVLVLVEQFMAAHCGRRDCTEEVLGQCNPALHHTSTSRVVAADKS